MTDADKKELEAIATQMIALDEIKRIVLSKDSPSVMVGKIQNLLKVGGIARRKDAA